MFLYSVDDLAELDWSKIRDMEFQERYRDKRAMMRSLKSFDCVHCPDLVHHVFYSRLMYIVCLGSHGKATDCSNLKFRTCNE
jgi:hypothetical protein